MAFLSFLTSLWSFEFAVLIIVLMKFYPKVTIRHDFKEKINVKKKWENSRRTFRQMSKSCPSMYGPFNV